MVKMAKNKNIGAISIAELKDLLRDNLNALWENDPALHTKHADASMMIPPVMVWGTLVQVSPSGLYCH